jgi:hypothetical protein
MLTHSAQTASRKSPAAPQPSRELTQLWNKVKTALPLHVNMWAEQEARRFARAPQNCTRLLAGLDVEIRSRFQPLAHAQGTDAAVFESMVRFAVMFQLHKQLADTYVATAQTVQTKDADAHRRGPLTTPELLQDRVRNQRETAMSEFENFDQKTNQLFNLLVTVLKSMSEMRSGILRNMV